ncbi:multisubunit sodium/proton antiporter MrpD subunit [Tamaricihabitans halophyticus]|uniref:Multisubunit sodium/proton antiporter MrpD subunit n=1 Tax=Tamaricihabitans halophyticus TaxID=1262583 RepID=A0A4R2QVT1_9PSEU|nr:monovalent cation/H+ antiporter subunit D family protein [Tamaricihabitans halophyticus]TCP52988.1 multisubunit sodium/proton antiporter MrpD subunit [Tamaricihabitans halophyticus]
MIGSLLALLVAVPLVAAGVLMMTGHRPRLHATVLLTILIGSTGSSALLVYAFADGGAVAHGVGSWPFGIAIPFAADMFAALMLTVTGLLAVTCVVFAIASRKASARFFAPLMLVLLAGVNGVLLTADLFNLFVFIEVMLLPSYGLFVLAAQGKAALRQIAGARLYVTLNLLTSTIFLAGVGFIYGTAGTVNLAELAAAAKADDTVAIAVLVCLFALGIKASIVPVHGWLARTYPATSPAITALFSGLHTKVAIYAIYRIYAVVFDGDTRWLWIGVLIFSATMIIGVFGAVGAGTTRSILAFHMVSQIGYILLGVALFTEAGLTAGIFYLLHHMIVKASLFLSTGAIEVRYGTGTIGQLSGIAKREPVIAVAFFIAALSLAGLPPFSGFVAKLSLIIASVDAGQIAAAVVMLLVSLITLLSMLKIWSGVFWGKDEVADGGQLGTAPVLTATREKTQRVGALLAAPAVLLAAITVGFGLGAELLLSLSQTAAAGLADPTAYIEAVINS